jgi:uncharacterized protein (DUF885 family)
MPRGRNALAAVALAGTLASAAEPPAAALIRQTGEEFLRIQLEESPLLRLRRGLPVERLTDLSDGHEREVAERARTLRARLDGLRAADLAQQDALSLIVLRRQLQAIADGPRFRALRLPVTPYASPLGESGQLFGLLPLADAAARDRYLRLLRQLPAQIAELSRMLSEQAARGVSLAKDELASVAPFLSRFKGDVDRSPFGVPAARLAHLKDPEARAFRAEVGRVLEVDVNPALQGLVDFVSGDYEKKASASVGLSQYPGGREYYEWLVRWHTTLDVSPERVHDTGLAEVARIEAEMAKVRERVGFRGSQAEFKQFLKTDARFFPKTPEEIGERLMAHIRRIEPKVDAFFLRKPKAPYGVKRLEPQLEPGQTFGYYQIPAGDDPKGYYRFNGSSLADRSLLNAGTLIAHELVPGHHFQINLAFETPDLPEFRRESFDTAYTEGWGDYAAAVAGEMGMYEDPYDLYGRLAMDMFISVRLVVDTGMNALGWSRAKAMDFMREHAMETETQIASETLRYCCDIPGQALAYKMGSLRIRALRDEAAAALGARFDIRRFHDAILGSGSLPMSALEQRVRWFIEDEKPR